MNPAALKAAVSAWQQAKALHAAGQLRASEPYYRKALQILPATADLLADYGRLAEQLGDWNAAEKIWHRFSVAAPTRPALNHRGLALIQLDRFDDALAVLQAHQQRYPDDLDSLVNVAVCLSRLGRDQDAIRLLRNASARQPDHELVQESLATLLINAGEPAEAENVLRDAIARFPGNNDLRYMLMEHRLKTGDFAGGFDLFDARWGTRFVGQAVALPRDRLWDGEPFEGKLLVRAEQGIGDELLYSNLFGDLLARHADTVFDCDRRLLPLFARSFPQATFIPRDTPEDDPARAGYARQCVAGDLCRWLRRSIDDFPRRSGWLKADAARRDALLSDYRSRYGSLLRVGISWRSRHPANGPAKSLTLEQLKPLLALPGIRFFALQYGDTAGEIRRFAEAHGIDLHVEPAVDPTDDLDGLAAQIDAMDVVVSTSNSTVHLAGALGVPTWVMLQRDQGLSWYWGYEGERVPWYPNTRLLRCPARGDWQPVINEAASRLAARARTGS